MSKLFLEADDGAKAVIDVLASAYGEATGSLSVSRNVFGKAISRIVCLFRRE